MRISQDSTSWRAGGIVRRDFRHTHDGPEVDRFHSPPKRRKPRKPRAHVVPHVHSWVEKEAYSWARRELPKIQTVYECSFEGCRRTKILSNPRYRYQMYKLRKKHGSQYWLW